MIDTGKAFCVANKQFINGIRDLAQYSSNDAVVETSLTKFSDSLQEMINFHTILFDQTQRSIKAQLQNFVKEDLRKFKDAKKQFEKVSEEKENALVKNAQVQRNKQHEVEEATNILTATRKCFRHIALDYVLQMLSFMYAHLAFFHQGYDLFSELGPYMKDLGSQLDRLAVDAAKEKREMEQKHSTIQQKDFSSDDSKLEYNVDAANGIVMEGYLFKRASNAFKTWNRSCMLQADSEKLRQAWIKAVQTSIATAYREKGDESEKLDKKSSPSTGSLDSGNESKEKLLKGESALQRVQCIPGNASCCDCGLADPRWASINLGITLCIECSGIHRQVCLFLKRGANQHATDEEGKDPLSIAVEAANADIVTLLRLARMNEEMRESEGLYGQPGDETYQDIFRDFSQMASNNPEKLNRFQQESQKF
ncbi:Arf-GAP with coiled-coil, ANK repeat and PH domain-containing protein 2 [Sciurus carolinensis]|uniref:Arf-GAP with coiled-coil, ANK repeat and PH domain-containing protein n=1 Tax=Sciurus carolinensis TaxID=30640 RepID=A0AA41TAN9_SCICA|nr:Arf-GAP with coiled-coil, ANK repeat and PH domain-containing protein 2 [Sciurus carolinensis]